MFSGVESWSKPGLLHGLSYPMVRINTVRLIRRDRDLQTGSACISTCQQKKPHFNSTIYVSRVLSGQPVGSFKSKMAATKLEIYMIHLQYQLGDKIGIILLQNKLWKWKFIGQIIYFSESNESAGANTLWSNQMWKMQDGGMLTGCIVGTRVSHLVEKISTEFQQLYTYVSA